MARLGSTWFKAARLNLERPPSARARAGMSMSLEDALGVAGKALGHLGEVHIESHAKATLGAQGGSFQFFREGCH